jgi:hypothetical protein
MRFASEAVSLHVDSSCAVYGGPLLYACPLNYLGDIFVCLILVRSFLATSMASALGLD